MSSTASVGILIAVCVFAGGPLYAEDPLRPNARPVPQKYPVVVTPGTPSIWSMEQAHYLLNRLRATNDGIQTKTPSADDLDPNAMNGLSLEALQTTLNAGAALNGATGLQNRVALQQFSQQQSQHDLLISQAQTLQNQLFRDQRTLANLKGQQLRLQAIQTANAAKTPPVNDPVLTRRLATLDGQIETLTDQNAATADRVTALTTQAGSVPSTPTLQTVTPPTPLSAPSQVLSPAVQTLLGNTASGFAGPKLPASIVLDNHLQMGVEIVAKQLTTLRDETGAHRRILFLEMPTLIQASDRRVILNGGEDKLAQSWWRVTKIYSRYKTEDSPCWSSNEFDPDELRYSSRPDRAPAGDATLRLDVLKKAGDDLQADYSALRDMAEPLQAGQPLDDVSLQTLVNKVVLDRRRFRSYREEFLSAAAHLGKQNPDGRSLSVVVPGLESSCRDARNARDEDEQRQKAKSGPNANKKAADALESIRKIRSYQLDDQLDVYKAEIYLALGGPEGMLRAFPHDIHSLDKQGRRIFGEDNGTVRAVDLIPQQTSLNVNSAHALVRNSALSFAWNTLFGFGLKVDYQRQKENYDQFIQQESFASSFGKGQATFGWTFGPLPGTRVLNSGDRNTYAVLEVPDDTSYIEVEGLGCAFHRKHLPLRQFPDDSENRDGLLEDYHCGDQLRTELRVPDRTNSGGFWLSGVDYEPVDPGSTASVVLRGGYFPPETTILVNGRRIPQVLGVGKPAQSMDAGPEDPAPDAAAVSGVFEYVNREQLTVSLDIPASYTGPDFPVITVVAPARAMSINSLPLRINGKSGRLSDETLVTKKPGSKMSISAVQYLSAAGGVFTAHLKGQKMTDLDKVRLNGKECTNTEPLSEGDAQITCAADSQSQWEFIGLTSDANPKIRVVSSLTIPNPRLIMLTGTQLLDGTEYGDDLHPSLISVQLTGSGFTPRTVLASAQADPSRFMLTYVNPTTLICVIRKPQPTETILISDQDRDGPAAILVLRPDDQKKEAPAAGTTTTTTQTMKRVVKY